MLFSFEFRPRLFSGKDTKETKEYQMRNVCFFFDKLEDDLCDGKLSSSSSLSILNDFESMAFKACMSIVLISE